MTASVQKKDQQMKPKAETTDAQTESSETNTAKANSKQKHKDNLEDKVADVGELENTQADLLD